MSSETLLKKKYDVVEKGIFEASTVHLVIYFDVKFIYELMLLFVKEEN